MLLEAHIAKPMPNNSPMALGEVIRQKDHPEMRLEGDTVAWLHGGFEYRARWLALKLAPVTAPEKKPDAPPPSPEPEAKPADDTGRSAKGPGRGRATRRRAP